MNILCIIPTLGHGGAQRVLVELAEHLAAKTHYQVAFLIFKGDEEYFYKPSEKIPVHCTDSVQGGSISWLALFQTTNRVRKKIKSIAPDLIISFQDVANFPTLLATLGHKSKVIVSERLDPTYHPVAKARRLVRSLLYPLADSIVVQTSHIAKQMPKRSFKKVSVIPNPAPNVSMIAATHIPSENGFRAIAAGRLEEQKNFSFLIDAIAHAQSHLDGWHIDIYGEGSQRKHLQDKIESLGLDKLITIHSAIKDLGAEMRQSHLYLLTSKYEGFPNVLLEAIAYRLPCIANRSVSGVDELIQNNINGIALAANRNSPEHFGDKLAKLANNADLRESMGKNCKKIVETYHRDELYSRWEDLITNIIAGTPEFKIEHP